MPAPFEFDYKNPDYISVYQWRMERLQRIRANPELLPILFEYYGEHIGDFITHWGMTFDPRNADIGLPTEFPFVLFDKQEEWVDWLLNRWRRRERGITEKSRDMGVSWLALSVSCTLCTFREGLTIGFGSRKEDYVDKIDDPKSLFWKARFFMDNLPREFKRGWQKSKHAPFMRIIFPETNSYMTGEAGDNIGRGDRTSLHFVDEHAHIPRAELIEASLSNTTNCRIDVSSTNGMANVFAQKRHSGKIPVFTFHWRFDPRKDEAWYNKMKDELDEVTLAREIDIDYTASAEGILIPGMWARSAIGAAEFLGIRVTGGKRSALDVADEGIDLNAISTRKGIELIGLNSWSGKGSDTFVTAEKAVIECDDFESYELDYDADGIGAGIRGDINVINERRLKAGQPKIDLSSFRGSGKVIDPTKDNMVKGRKNEDYFANRKAQSWWSLRLRFQLTHRAVTAKKEGKPIDFDPESLISILPTLPLLDKLIIELSQPTYEPRNGKILIDKAPEGTRSPNLADSVMMVYAPISRKSTFF